MLVTQWQSGLLLYSVFTTGHSKSKSPRTQTDTQLTLRNFFFLYIWRSNLPMTCVLRDERSFFHFLSEEWHKIVVFFVDSPCSSWFGFFTSRECIVATIALKSRSRRTRRTHNEHYVCLTPISFGVENFWGGAFNSMTFWFYFYSAFNFNRSEVRILGNLDRNTTVFRNGMRQHLNYPQFHF